jgi:hypothetical protein
MLARKSMNSDTLKQDLRKCALVFSERRGLPVDDSHTSAVIFSNIADNFHPDSFANLTKHSDWNARTMKPHQKVPGVKEMQSSNSSDALLMNIFCHPSIRKWTGVKKVLGNDLESIAFGFAGAVRISNGQTDTTEIDMALSGVFCEAKLTESDFTHKRRSVVENYDGLYETFHVEALPRAGDDYDNYQIIRNLLAATQQERKHILLCDERRPDLVRRYMTTVSCLRDVHRRMKCRVIFWQEIVDVCGKSLREWTEEKYGLCQQAALCDAVNRAPEP